MGTDLLATGGSILMDNALMGGTAYTPREDWGPKQKNGPYVVQCNEFLQTQTDIHRVSNVEILRMI